MHIPREFDESNIERRKRIFNNHLKSSKNLNLRIKQHINNINSNYSFSESDKKKLIEEIFNEVTN